MTTATAAGERKEYVVGLLFDGRRDYVALIQKNRPDWQKGLLNGPGGRVEPDDQGALNAMNREFEEETGVSANWRPFCTLENERVVVTFFTASREANLKSLTDEKVGWYNLAGLGDLPLVPNLRFLIPMALYALDVDTKTGFFQAKLLEDF